MVLGLVMLYSNIVLVWGVVLLHSNGTGFRVIVYGLVMLYSNSKRFRGLGSRGLVMLYSNGKGPAPASLKQGAFQVVYDDVTLCMMM